MYEEWFGSIVQMMDPKRYETAFGQWVDGMKQQYGDTFEPAGVVPPANYRDWFASWSQMMDPKRYEEWFSLFNDSMKALAPGAAAPAQ